MLINLLSGLPCNWVIYIELQENFNNGIWDEKMVVELELPSSYHLSPL